MTNFLVINPLVMSHKKCFNLFDFLNLSFFSLQDELERWR